MSITIQGSGCSQEMTRPVLCKEKHTTSETGSKCLLSAYWVTCIGYKSCLNDQIWTTKGADEKLHNLLTMHTGRCVGHVPVLEDTLTCALGK